MEWLRSVINPYLPAAMLANNFYNKQRALVPNRDIWRDNRDWEARQPKAQKEIKQLAVLNMVALYMSIDPMIRKSLCVTVSYKL